MLPGLKLGPHAVHHSVDVRGDAAEIAIRDAGVNVVNRRDVVVIDDRLNVAPRHGRDVAERVRDRRWCAPRRARDGGVQEVVDGRDLPFRRLHREIIGNALLRIDPEIRVHLLGRAEADRQIVHDLLGLQIEVLRARAVDVEVQVGRVELLLDVSVDDARNGRRPAFAFPSRSRDCSDRGPGPERRSASARRSSGFASPCRRAGNRTADPGRPPAVRGAAL